MGTMSCPPMTVTNNKWDRECSRPSTRLAAITADADSEGREKEIKPAPHAESLAVNQRTMLVHGARAVFGRLLSVRVRAPSCSRMTWLRAAVSPSWAPARGGWSAAGCPVPLPIPETAVGTFQFPRICTFVSLTRPPPALFFPLIYSLFLFLPYNFEGGRETGTCHREPF